MIYKHFQRNKKQGIPTQAAVIRYDKEKEAPTVVAQGRGEVAQKIIVQAKKHDIPLQEDALLLENLLELDLGHNVPPQLYQVVAEVLLLVRRANMGENGLKSNPVRSILQNTPYWEEDELNDNREVDDITIEDLLRMIRKI